MRIFHRLIWFAVAAVAALCLGYIATERGEPINSLWLVVAAVCTYLIGYRFYAGFIAAKVMMLD
ncbi:MAG: carbon starvation CstA family protein, partial [Bryobacteraceae bacterium]